MKVYVEWERAGGGRRRVELAGWAAADGLPDIGQIVIVNSAVGSVERLEWRWDPPPPPAPQTAEPSVTIHLVREDA